MQKAAIYAAGLPRDSRIVRLLSKADYSVEIKLLALIADLLNLQIWQASGCKGSRPSSIVDKLDNTQEQVQGFDTPEEFERAMHRIEQRAAHNGI